MTATTTFARCILKIIKRRSYVIVHNDTHLTWRILLIRRAIRRKQQIKECALDRANLFEFFEEKCPLHKEILKAIAWYLEPLSKR